MIVKRKNDVRQVGTGRKREWEEGREGGREREGRTQWRSTIDIAKKGKAGRHVGRARVRGYSKWDDTTGARRDIGRGEAEYSGYIH